MNKRQSQIEYRHAVQQASREDRSEPRAKSAHYDRRTEQIVVELKSGATFIFSTVLAQGIAGAAGEDLDRIEISPSGEALRWPTLDADFSLPKLMRGVFGTKVWMQNLRRQARKVQKTVPSSVRVRNRDSHRQSS